MAKKERDCAKCNTTMLDMSPEGNDNTGWFYCLTCEIEILPKFGEFQMYDTVELIGASWADGSKVIGACKGYKDGKIGVSTDSSWGFYPPDKLKLLRRLEDGKWVTHG
jgi:hypothetical protein